METIIITNNPRVNIEYLNKENVLFFPDLDQIDILKKARDYIHLGSKLIAHPMMGRIKPHETPYKSVYLEEIKGNLDFISLQIIEDSIAETNKFLSNTYMIKYVESNLEDLAYIEYLLLKNAVEEYENGK